MVDDVEAETRHRSSDCRKASKSQDGRNMEPLPQSDVSSWIGGKEGELTGENKGRH